MRNKTKRNEKAEAKTQAMGLEASDREAKLLEIQRLGNDDPMAVFKLRMELEYGPDWTLAEVIADLHRMDRNDRNQQNPTE